MLKTMLRSRARLSWLILVIATPLSVVIGIDHGTGSSVTVLVFGIAAAKIRLVGLDFMELRGAPIPLRALFEAYCVALWAVLSGIYLWY
jgi:hypothetical protein